MTVRKWVHEEGQIHTAAYVANATLSLLNLCSHLLDRQIAVQAAEFEQKGGFESDMMPSLQRRSAWECGGTAAAMRLQ